MPLPPEARAGVAGERRPAVRPFEVDVPPEALDDLRERIRRTRWPDEVAGSGWDYGTDLGYLRSLLDHWAGEFDWWAEQRRINQFAHFRAEIDGLGVHFVHERGRGPAPLPLLLLHGWPSSFVQMLRIVPLLADPARFGGDPADAFDVVVPSLPGYAFSDAATTPGLGLSRIAELFSRLMGGALGYGRYGVRATDLGASIAAHLAWLDEAALVGFHSGGTDPWVADMELPDDLTEPEREFVANARAWNENERAYAEIQATKPQSLAYGLNDSPAGLAAWIVEKLRSWSDCGGDLDRGTIGRDDLLANLTIYWVTQTIGSSMRLYYEARRDTSAVHLAFAPVRVPFGIAQPPRDMFPTPREWLERFYRIDRYTELEAGGHFPEWEQPQALAEDLRAFFRPLR